MKKIPHNVGPALVIGIPTLGRPVNLDWAMALKSLNPPVNYNSVFQIIKGQPIDVARNSICRYALDSGAKYVFFLGDDVIVPGYTLRQLIYRMEQDPQLGVVGGVYCAKCDPPAPLVFRGNGKGSYWDWKIGEYFEVSGMGMDCTLIRTEILKDLPEPWFKTVESDQFLDGINNAESWTEDLYFFNQLEKTVWTAFIDSYVMCHHFDIYTEKVYYLPPDSLPMRRRVTTKNKSCLFIGKPVQVDEEIAKEYDIVWAGAEDGVDYRVDYSMLPFADEQFDRVEVLHGLTVPPSEIERILKKVKVEV